MSGLTDQRDLIRTGKARLSPMGNGPGSLIRGQAILRPFSRGRLLRLWRQFGLRATVPALPTERKGVR